MSPGRSWADRGVCGNPLAKKSQSMPSPRCTTITLSSDDEDNDSGDNVVCNWFDRLHSYGPVTLTPFDKRLWESLLDCNDTLKVQTQSNGNNNRWGRTSEELIQTSTPTASPLLTMQSHERSPPTRPEQNITWAERGQSLSPSATPGAFRVVNWAAEPNDQRWNKHGALGPRPPPRAKGSWRRPKVLPKRISPRGVGAPGYIGRLKSHRQREPFILGGVSGVEMFLSSVLDSPLNGAVGEGCVEANRYECPPACLSRHRVVPNSLVLPNEKRQQHWQLTDQLTDCQVLKQFEIRNLASAGSQEVSVSQCRIPASETPWQPSNKSRSLPRPSCVGSSELTMEFSGDSSSSAEEDEDDEIETEQVDEATVQKFRDSPKNHLPQMRPINSELFKTRRNVVISVSGGKGRAGNSKSVSTNTERSASTLVNGASEGTQRNGALEPLPACLNGALPHESSQTEVSNEGCTEDLSMTTGELCGSAPVLLHRPHAPLLAAELPQFPFQAARMLIVNLSSLITPVWLGCQVEIGVVSVATMRQCLPDSNRFVWQRMQPARCSRACSSLLSGQVDNSQSSENRLPLQRFPVYIHCRDSKCALAAIVAIDRYLLAVGVRLTSLEVTTALRYIGPSEVADADPMFPNILAPSQSPPLALPWPQPQITFPQWSRIAESSLEPVLPAPTRSLLFHAAPNDAELLNNWSSSSRRQSGRKGDQMRELRRIVRLRMRRKVRDNEFIGVPDPPCSYESSSSITVSAAAPSSETDEPKRGGQSIGGETSQIFFPAGAPERHAASGLLDSLRSCQQTAAAAATEFAAVQQQHHQQPGSATTEQLACLAEFVERILHESCSQQAALNNLLTALKSRGGANSCDHGLELAVVARSEEVEASARTVATISPSEPSSSGISESSSVMEEQFYSVVGTAPDAATRATGLTADQFHSPAATNNNAEDAISDAGTLTSAVSGRKRHRTFYACKRVVRLEESAAILVQETTCQASSIVAAIQLVGESSSRSSSPSKSLSNENSATKKRFSAERIRSIERKTLMKAWGRKPPVDPRLLEQLDPTLSSFIWWSLLPREGRLALNPSAASAMMKSKTPILQSQVLQTSSSTTIQPSSLLQPSSCTSPGADRISANHCQLASCELEMMNQLSSTSTVQSSANFSAIEFDNSLAALSILTFGK